MKKITITRKQAEVFWLISGLHRTNGYAPTIRELAADLGKSIGTVQTHLAVLRNKGLVEWLFGRCRTIKPRFDVAIETEEI